jgi:hypothetical protein
MTKSTKNDLIKSLENELNHISFEKREFARSIIIKSYLMDYLGESELTLEDIAKEPDLFKEHDMFDEWSDLSNDIYLFLGIDIIEVANDFLDWPNEYCSINESELVSFYANNIVWENIHQWAEEEKKGATNANN